MPEKRKTKSTSKKSAKKSTKGTSAAKPKRTSKTKAKSPSLSSELQEALSFHEQGKLKEAEGAYRNIIRNNPDEPDAYHLLGVIAFQTEHFEPAVQLIQQAIRRNPKAAAYQNNLALAHKALGQWEAALTACQASIKLDGKFSEAHYNLGTIFQALGRTDEATDAYSKAVEIKSDFPKAINNLGNMLLRQGKYEEALKKYEECLALKPDAAGIINNMGNIHRILGDTDRALDFYHLALEKNPNSYETYNNMGSLYFDLNDFKQSKDAYDKALKIKPDYVECICNVARWHSAQNHLEQAADDYQKALEIKPTLIDAHMGKGIALLRQGKLKEGWEELEYRPGIVVAKRPDLPFKDYQGEPLAETDILIYREQSVGDELIFSSCLLEIAAEAKNCFIECEPRFAQLYKRSMPNATVIKPITPADKKVFDKMSPDTKQLAIGSMPRWLRPTIDSFPETPPTLKADDTLVVKWKEKLQKLGPGLKVGIAWKGRNVQPLQRRFTIELNRWERVLTVPNVNFISLQHDDNETELKEVEKNFGMNIHRIQDIQLQKDIDDTVALIKNLDLVITSGTYIFGLAGAMGVKTWLLTPYTGFWETLGTNRMLWFPSVTIYQENDVNSWGEVLGRVADDLGKFVDGT